MLLMRLFAAARRPRAGRPPPDGLQAELPFAEERRLVAAHGRAPVERHLDILYGDYRIGQARFIDMYRDAMRATGTVLTPFNVFLRFDTRAQLCRYLEATLDVPGHRAECGAYRGATALLLCRALASHRPGYDGSGMHLHLSLFSGDDNAFYEEGAEYGLSKIALGFVAGLLHHGREITAVTNQWVNSYKRLVSGFDAPVYEQWGSHDQSAVPTTTPQVSATAASTSPRGAHRRKACSHDRPPRARSASRERSSRSNRISRSAFSSTRGVSHGRTSSSRSS